MQDTLVAPAHLWVPPHTSTSGGEAADFAASIGITLDPEQRMALDAILAERADGRWAAFEAAVIASRQNLKTFLFQVVALSDLFLFGSELTVWTAHLFPTAVEAFRNIKIPLESYPHLSRRVRKVTEANGEEGIELIGGQRLLFKARSKSGGRGLTGDRVILDEAFALSPSEMGSLLPTLSARPNPQVLYGSSAGMLGSDVLRRVRDRGRAGNDPSLAYLEWCAPVVACADDRCDHRPPFEGCALDDRDAWRKANPAMGRRISEEHIAAERRTLPPEEFARERLGWWEEPEDGLAGLPLELWQSRVHGARNQGKPVAYGVDVTPDFSWSCVTQVAVLGEQRIVRVLRHERGTKWVAPFVAGLLSPAVRAVVDMSGPASVIGADLAAMGVEPLATSGRDMAQACAGFLDGLIRDTIRHTDQAELNDAVMGAARRPLGDAWAWSRKASTVDISPLVSATLAAWGVDRSPAPQRPAVLHLEDYLDEE